ncbi:unnamed protein product [Camellia sinensis]
MELGHHAVTSLFSLEKRNLFPCAPHITTVGAPNNDVLKAWGENLAILSCMNFPDWPFQPSVRNSRLSPRKGSPVFPGGRLLVAFWLKKIVREIEKSMNRKAKGSIENKESSICWENRELSVSLIVATNGVYIGQILNVMEFAGMLNCKVKSAPIKYLGLPLGASPHRKVFWKPVLDKIKLRLAGWKRRLLSFAGRLTLIKSVLSSLPVYYLSLFKIPEGIAKEIEKLQASFLWGGVELKRKVHLVRWDEVTKSTKQGGLGVRRIRDMNVCLLMKWWWRYANEEQALWKQVLVCKYKAEGGNWRPDIHSGGRVSKIWGDILVAANQNVSLLQFYINNLQIRVGNG